MQHKARRIFQWFNFGLLVVVLALFCWLAVLFIRYPADHQQFVIGWLLLLLCAIPLGSLGWWAVKRRRSNPPMRQTGR
jgi:hypothetical protein